MINQPTMRRLNKERQPGQEPTFQVNQLNVYTPTFYHITGTSATHPQLEGKTQNTYPPSLFAWIEDVNRT